jgi:hypothetical protein
MVEGDRHFAVIDLLLAGETAKARKGTSTGRIRQIFKIVDGEWESTRVKTGLSSGEGLINEVRDPVKDGAKVIDPGIEDKRLLVFESEFAGALTMMRRPGSVLSRVIRDAWDCRDLATLTKNNPTRATGPHTAALSQAGESGMTRTAIRDLFGRHRKGHEIDAALGALAARGKAKCITGVVTGGRPPTLWIGQGNGS